MKIGIIGAGRVGCSVGKYVMVNSNKNTSINTITGFYSRSYDKAAEAANFCNVRFFKSLTELITSSDTLFITTQDEQISKVWDCIDKALIKNKIICHFSGSISSDVFTNAGDYGAYCGSVHPVYAFSSRFDSYKNMKEIFFTLEGHKVFLEKISSLFSNNGNKICYIEKADKPLYHSALSMASNHLLGLLSITADTLTDCGFSKNTAYEILKPLMLSNLQNALKNGAEQALTGPIERGDSITVEKHLKNLHGRQKEIYRLLGLEILDIAKNKNEGKPVAEKYSEIERKLLN